MGRQKLESDEIKILLQAFKVATMKQLLWLQECIDEEIYRKNKRQK